MSNSYAKKFGPISKAPKSATRNNTLLSKAVAICAAAIAFVKLAFVGDRTTIKARDIHEASDVFGVYKRSNAIGDILGHGRKDGGIGLRRDETGAFEVTQENLQRAIQVLDEAGLSRLMTELDIPDVDILSTKIGEFPNEDADDADANDSDPSNSGGDSGDDIDNGNSVATAEDDESEQPSE